MAVTDQIWIVDDDSSIRWVMEKALSRAGLNCRAFESGDEMLDALSLEEPMVVVSDIRMPGMDGIKLLSRIKSEQPKLPVIITTAHSDLDSAVNSYEEGAFEYLPKPFDIEEMVATVTRAQSQRDDGAKTSEGGTDNPSAEIIGNAPAMQEVFRAIGRLAQSHITVLINGESGTGKELVARALHRHSPRADNAFVALNMAAIPQELMESELFGHEKGAFTGANSRREGRFEQARGGTLFLDEIGDMPLALQTRLLRVLEEREVVPLGGDTPIALDLNVISATHADLGARVASGDFRSDLYYRLDGITLTLPAVRERADRAALLRSVIASEHDGAAAIRIAEDAMKALVRYDWPGNIRQIRNVMRTALALCEDGLVRLADLPEEITHQAQQSAASTCASDEDSVVSDNPLANAERDALIGALEHNSWNVSRTAAQLATSRNTLYRKMKKHAIEPAQKR